MPIGVLFHFFKSKWVNFNTINISHFIHQEVQTALEQFNHYHSIWQRDRAEEIAEFMTREPRLSEFEWQIISYEDLERQINSEREYYNVGAIALYTGQYCWYSTNH